MARVIIPQNARTYNHNPQGSATATVTMKAHNPFENRNVGRDGLLPAMTRVRGLSGLGAEVYGPPAPPAPTPAPASGGIDWGAIAAATATAMQPLATAEAQRLLNKGTAQVPGAPMYALPVGQQPYPAPKPASKLPWILTGVGVLGLVVAAVLVMRKRK